MRGEGFGNSPAEPQGSDTGLDCPQTSQGLSAAQCLGLKGAGHFSPYKEGSFACLLLGRNSQSLGVEEVSGGIWSLSVPEAG